jgi:hypothetical protein
MIEILKIIHSITGESEWRRVNSDELFFELGNFCITIKLILDEEDYENDFNLIDDIDEFIVNNNPEGIKNINVAFIEDPELRNYARDSDDRDQCPSVARTIFKQIQELSSILENISTDISFKLDYGDPMCGGEPNFVGSFNLNLEVISRNNISQIFKLIENFEIKTHSEIYYRPLNESESLTPNYRTSIINTNTKVRRLGYLKLFFDLLYRKKKLPESFVNKKFEDYVVNFNSFLDTIDNNKGLIQSLNGKSAQPYYELARELGLVASVNRVIVPSKFLKVYNELRVIFPSPSINPFILDELDRLFFIEILLKEDYLYLSIILECIYIKKSQGIKAVIGSFQNLLLERLKSQLLYEEFYKDNKNLAEVKTIKKRVEAWTKPTVYLEHVIMPRLNWMIDLELISMTENSVISITPFGERFFNELASWIDVRCEQVENVELFLKDYFPHALCSASYQFYWEKRMPIDDVVSLVKLYIDKSFECFKTIAPNRVTSSQAILFTKYCMYLNHKFSISYNSILTILEKNLKDYYIYKYQPQYEDGYIQKS